MTLFSTIFSFTLVCNVMFPGFISFFSHMVVATTDDPTFTSYDCKLPNAFRCGSVPEFCISNSWVCDDSVDCDNGRDEKGCHPVDKCPEDFFKCANENCIDKSYLCNGVDNCGDNSDEDEDACHRESASTSASLGTQTAHPKPTPEPVPPCRAYEYQCENGPCIWKDLVCDTYKDCPHGDDERNCTSIKCKLHEFACLDRFLCVPRHQVCDGIKECKDGSDEQNCTTATTTTTTTADPHAHLPSLEEYRDGSHFKDGYDGKVWHDGHRICNASEFRCVDSGYCIPRYLLCNWIRDCEDDSDEGKGCEACDHNNGGCQQECRNTPSGPECHCRVGWRKAHDGISCEDVDECMEGRGSCSHYCMTFGDTYKCSCARGYALQNDGATCKLIDTHAGSIAMSFGHEIQNVRFHTWADPHKGHDTNHVRDAYHSNIYGLDVDAEQHSYFYTIGEIVVFLAGTKESCLVSNLETHMSNVALDWVTKNIYFLTDVPASLGVCTPGGHFCKTLATQKDGLSDTKGLALHPKHGCITSYTVWHQNLTWAYATTQDITLPPYVCAAVLIFTGHKWPGMGSVHAKFECAAIIGRQDKSIYLRIMFWTDAGARPRIERANMDFTDRRTLIDTNLGWPNAIAVDYVHELLYFGVAGDQPKIERCRLDGTDRQVVFTGGVHHPFDIAVFDGRVYWSDQGSYGIASVTLNGADHMLLESDMQKPFGIAVSHGAAQERDLPNPCANATCSHICVLAEETYGTGSAEAVCLCPNGYEFFDGSNDTCVPVEQKAPFRDLGPRFCNSSFIEACNEAQSKICQNGGSCKRIYRDDLEIDARCECPPKMLGKYCEVNMYTASSAHTLLAPSGGRRGIVAGVLVFMTIIIIICVVIAYIFRHTNYRQKIRALRWNPASVIVRMRRSRYDDQRQRIISVSEDGSRTPQISKANSSFCNPVYEEEVHVPIHKAYIEFKNDSPTKVRDPDTDTDSGFDVHTGNGSP